MLIVEVRNLKLLTDLKANRDLLVDFKRKEEKIARQLLKIFQFVYSVKLIQTEIKKLVMSIHRCHCIWRSPHVKLPLHLQQGESFQERLHYSIIRPMLQKVLHKYKTLRDELRKLLSRKLI